jgi:HD-GYP domain-containing protein (c-di-GMP phosphodiesterase class II)
MNIVYENHINPNPHISFILMDWGCRESFHTIEYLNNQTVPRDSYEIIWIEYYNRKPTRIKDLIDRYEKCGLESPINTWIVMARPKGEVFRKHWINNIGILHAKGKIVCFIDSDAITNPTLVDTIAREFENNRDIILYSEEIRTADKAFYPFGYPNPKEIIPTAVNMKNGVPVAMRNFSSGLLADPSLIHCRNYGACFSARKEDLISIGGWDEHEDYTGYIAGPYEMSMRMELTGKQEVWSHFELLYHVPHPGNSGIDNYSGPHDGKGVSTTAMKILETKRLLPLVENKEIKALRLNLPEAVLVEGIKIGRNVGDQELAPTTPEKATDVYLPPASATNWDKKSFYMLARFYDEIEANFFNYRYSRIYAIGAYAALLAKKMGLSQDKIEAIYIASLFCDVGNIMKLSESYNGANNDYNAIIGNSFFSTWESEPFVTIKKVCNMYREHYDGSGKLAVKSSFIPLEARIVALAHYFDDQINMRNDSKAISLHELYDSIMQKSGKEFDPNVVDAFIDCLSDFVCINLKNQNNALEFMYPCYNFDEKSIFDQRTVGNISSSEEGGGFIKETCNEFNIYGVRCGNNEQYYAIPVWDDDLNLTDFYNNKYQFSYASNRLADVQQFAIPQLILQNIYGYNVIYCAGQYFALKCVEVEFKMERFIKGNYTTPCYIDKNFERLKKKIFVAKLKEFVQGFYKKIASKFLRR